MSRYTHHRTKLKVIEAGAMSMIFAMTVLIVFVAYEALR